MNIDYNKVSFNELDMEYPLQAFFNYETTQEEISEWLANEVTCDEIPEEITITGMELCLTIFGRHDFKLEAVCTSDGGSQFWVELDSQFTNADEFISLIPDYEKIDGDIMKNKKLKKLIEEFHRKLDEAIAARKKVFNYLEENYDIDTNRNAESLEDENLWCYGIDEDVVEILVGFSRASISK